MQSQMPCLEVAGAVGAGGGTQTQPFASLSRPSYVVMYHSDTRLELYSFDCRRPDLSDWITGASRGHAWRISSELVLDRNPRCHRTATGLVGSTQTPVAADAAAQVAGALGASAPCLAASAGAAGRPARGRGDRRRRGRRPAALGAAAGVQPAGRTRLRGATVRRQV